MRVTVTFRHVNSSDGLRSYATEKVERLEKFARRMVEAHVILAVEKQRHCAEIQVVGRGINAAAKQVTTDLYSAIDLAVDKVERQLKKTADKRKSRKGSPSAAASATPPAESTRQRRRVRAQRVAVKPMSVDDAVGQIEHSQVEFLLFRNAATDSLSVLYRKKDGSFGLLEPEPS